MRSAALVIIAIAIFAGAARAQEAPPQIDANDLIAAIERQRNAAANQHAAAEARAAGIEKQVAAMKAKIDKLEAAQPKPPADEEK